MPESGEGLELYSIKLCPRVQNDGGGTWLRLGNQWMISHSNLEQIYVPQLGVTFLSKLCAQWSIWVLSVATKGKFDPVFGPSALTVFRSIVFTAAYIVRNFQHSSSGWGSLWLTRTQRNICIWYTSCLHIFLCIFVISDMHTCHVAWRWAGLSTSWLGLPPYSWGLLDLECLLKQLQKIITT